MNKKILIILICLVAISASLYVLYPKQNKVCSTACGVRLAGMQEKDEPWIAETENLKQRLSAIGLPALKEEGQVLHSHQHIDVYINGKQTVIPSGIGVNETLGFISSIHTHDTTSVIHIESPVIEIFTLGQFFDVWGVRFTKDSIGGYKNTDKRILRVFVNGIEVKTDPRLVELKSHQEIVVVYGTDLELPNPLPSTYEFASGL